jgi:NADPH:quinone reductase-like Zn-dependent oxidoreductase
MSSPPPVVGMGPVMADVVLNSLGIQTWENSFESVGLNGRWVTFGGLTGADVKLNVMHTTTEVLRSVQCHPLKFSGQPR